MLNQCDSTNEFHYDPLQKMYTCRMVLKQGLYNYLVGWKKEGNTSIETDWVEGAHEETENQYDAMLYISGSTYPQYDKLIAYQPFSSLSAYNKK